MPGSVIGHGGIAANKSNNPFVFFIQALGLLLSFDHFADGIWTPQQTLSSLAALPCAECFNAPIDELRSGAFDGLMDRLDYAPFRCVSATATLSTLYTYKQRSMPDNVIGHGGIAVNMSNNPFVFFIQALGLLLSFDRFADGIGTPQQTVSSLAALPCAECFNAPIDELGSGAFDGLMDRLDYAPFRGVSATATLSTSYTYKHRSMPDNVIGHGGIAVNISNNPFVFSIQALGLLLSFDHFADGIGTPQQTVSSLAALQCAECFNAPIDELGSGAFDGLMDRLDYAPLQRRISYRNAIDIVHL
ncbi:hypothetical protein MRX96_010206 [Rhipicephalus microplus]